MKVTLLLILSFILCISCNSENSLSYEKALENYQNRIKDLKKENSKGFVYIGPECLVGAELPEFSQISRNGKPINRETLKGKLTILNFWFITCPPCIAEIPGFNQLVDKYGTDNINYIAIGRDSKKDIEEFLGETEWNFEHILDSSKLIKDTFEIKWGFPTTFLLNRDAQIVTAFSSGSADSTAIQKIQDKLIPLIEKEL